jgi:hypothetical protein
MTSIDNTVKTPVLVHDQYLLAAYAEVCKTYHALDDYRMKLLGLLPIASVVGLFSLQRPESTAVVGKPNEILMYVGIFAGLFTFALFMYEIRGILMCNDLILRGQLLENLMNTYGQFNVCDEQRQLLKSGGFRVTLARQFNARLAACAIYSLVMAAWVFVALRYGWGIQLLTCAKWAGGAGIALAATSNWLVHSLIGAEVRS